jgi:hypothetical protein
MARGVELETAVEVMDAVDLDGFVVEVVKPEVGEAFVGDFCVVCLRRGLLRVWRG